MVLKGINRTGLVFQNPVDFCSGIDDLIHNKHECYLLSAFSHYYSYLRDFTT
jgi:hypothetical protein